MGSPYSRISIDGKDYSGRFIYLKYVFSDVVAKARARKRKKANLPEPSGFQLEEWLSLRVTFQSESSHNLKSKEAIAWFNDTFGESEMLWAVTNYAKEQA